MHSFDSVWSTCEPFRANFLCEISRMNLDWLSFKHWESSTQSRVYSLSRAGTPMGKWLVWQMCESVRDVRWPHCRSQQYCNFNELFFMFRKNIICANTKTKRLHAWKSGHGWITDFRWFPWLICCRKQFGSTAPVHTINSSFERPWVEELGVSTRSDALSCWKQTSLSWDWSKCPATRFGSVNWTPFPMTRHWSIVTSCCRVWHFMARLMWLQECVNTAALDSHPWQCPGRAVFQGHISHQKLQAHPGFFRSNQFIASGVLLWEYRDPCLQNRNQCRNAHNVSWCVTS